MTPRELADPVVKRRMAELETRTIMSRAMNRARSAEAVAEYLDRMIRIVPHPVGDATTAWHTPDELRANLPDDLLKQAGQTRQAVMQQFGPPIPEISTEQTLRVLGPWATLKMSWQRGDAEAVQDALDRLADALPTLAPPGVYPSEPQRAAEARYYAMGKFTWGWVLYFFGILLSLWALVTRWRSVWWLSVTVLVAAMGVHAYGIALRWYILGRIPVANMFEAVISSAWIGCAIALVAELVYRKRIFLLGAHATGFLALVLGQFIIPGGGTLTSIMGILDDVMLRIHTVLIIASYSLIFLAAVIATVYLFGYYLYRQPVRSAEMGLIVFIAGLATWIAATRWVFTPTLTPQGSPVASPEAVRMLGWLAGLALVALGVSGLLRRPPFHLSAGLGLLAFSAALLALTPFGFVRGTAVVMIAGGLTWGLLTGIGMLWRRATLAGEPAMSVQAAGGGAAAAVQLHMQRPILAGAMPGDEVRARDLPLWLHHFDWCHLIILNMVFVLLFVGIILGAVWADYSWGRPWGWDPKEVFALTTWIIYAVLIHVRFVVVNRGLWTAWLSIAGCLMMAFNWCFVNFYIVGLHSYA